MAAPHINSYNPIVSSSENLKNSFEIIGIKRWVWPEIILIDAEVCSSPIPEDILSGALHNITFVTSTFFCTTAVQQIRSDSTGCHKNGSFLPVECMVLIQRQWLRLKIYYQLTQHQQLKEQENKGTRRLFG
jgi:hypothetical protein